MMIFQEKITFVCPIENKFKQQKTWKIKKNIIIKNYLKR